MGSWEKRAKLQKCCLKCFTGFRDCSISAPLSITVFSVDTGFPGGISHPSDIVMIAVVRHRRMRN